MNDVHKGDEIIAIIIQWRNEGMKSSTSVTLQGHPRGRGPNPVKGPGTRFSKVPKLFKSILGDIILFVSSKRRRLEAPNLAVMLIFIPYTACEKTSFTEYAGRSFTNGFSGPKSFQDFRETDPCFSKVPKLFGSFSGATFPFISSQRSVLHNIRTSLNDHGT